MNTFGQPKIVFPFSSLMLVAAAAALCCAEPSPRKGQQTSVNGPISAHPGLSSKTNLMIENLYRRIQSETAGIVGNAYRQSLPIPVRENNSTCILVMLCPAIVKAPQGSQVMPPTHVALYDPSKATLIEMRTVQPADFQQSHTANQLIGTANLPQGMTYDDYLEKRRHLFQALDRLLPSYSVPTQTLTGAEREAARDFKNLFLKLREAPLDPYYQYALKDFISWLNQFHL